MSALTSAKHAAPSKCSACDRPLDHPLLCTGCSALHAPGDRSYFELFDVPASYNIDITHLRARYLKLSREIHPDRFGARPEAMALAEKLSATLNEAFRVLNDPLLRAEYLLEISGGPSSQSDKTVPADVLTGTLMLNEELEEARSARDSAAVAALAARIEQQFDDAKRRIAALAENLPGDASARAQLRAALNTVRYFQRLGEQVALP